MHKAKAFALRNGKEMLRDPLSYIFCLGFPLVMLVMMTLVNQSIPAEAKVSVFQIENLTGGVIIFGQTFVMLFTAITVAKDRSSAFLLRMYATPMTSFDFSLGYVLPMAVIALCQGGLIGMFSLVLGQMTGQEMHLSGILAAIPMLLPSALLLIGLGLLSGTLFSEKAAPGLCSVIISLGSFLGSVWFDAEAAGGTVLKISKCLPFYYCTKSVRMATQLQLNPEDFLPLLFAVCLWAGAILSLAVFTFRKKMKAELG